MFRGRLGTRTSGLRRGGEKNNKGQVQRGSAQRGNCNFLTDAKKSDKSDA